MTRRRRDRSTHSGLRAHLYPGCRGEICSLFSDGEIVDSPAMGYWGNREEEVAVYEGTRKACERRCNVNDLAREAARLQAEELDRMEDSYWDFRTFLESAPPDTLRLNRFDAVIEFLSIPF